MRMATPAAIQLHVSLHPPMVNVSWDPISDVICPCVATISVPATSSLQQVTDACTRATNAPPPARRYAHYVYMKASMPRNGETSVYVPFECEAAWRHFSGETSEMCIVVRTELRANVFPSRFFTVADLVRHTYAPACPAWHPPRKSLPTMIHSSIDAIRRKQFSGALVHLIVPLTTTLEPGSVDGMAGSVLYGSRFGVHASQFVNNHLRHITLSKPTAHIHACAFAGSRLKTACFPPTLQRIGSSAFKSTLLTTLDLVNATALEVIEQSSFQYCALLETVNLPPTVRHVGAFCFESCTRLATVGLDRRAPMLVVEASTYLNARDLRRAPLTSSLISIQQDGFRSSGLCAVDLSGTRVSCIGDRAFSHCTHLEAFLGSPDLMALGVQAFSDCRQLESVDLSCSRGLTFVPPGCFDNCTALVHATLPNGLRSIRENGFRNCRRLRTITLPQTVGSVGPLAFANTRALRAIRLMGDSLPELSQTALKHSSAVVVSRRASTPAESLAVVVVPTRVATNADAFNRALLTTRLAGAGHHREQLRQRVRNHRDTATSLDIARERRHRQHFGGMPLLPLEIWEMIFRHNAPWPSKLPATFYLPRLLYKPAALVWARWLGGLPPLFSFLLNECTVGEIKFLACHTGADDLPRPKATLLPTHVYTCVAGPLPQSMIRYDGHRQLLMVCTLKTILAQRSDVGKAVARPPPPEECVAVV